MKRYLKNLDAWIAGLRRNQWATRAKIHKIEVDPDHEGIVKVNPLADWTKQQVWDYIHEHDVPYHALLDQGYTSIGCAPCTRGHEPRGGRRRRPRGGGEGGGGGGGGGWS